MLSSILRRSSSFADERIVNGLTKAGRRFVKFRNLREVRRGKSVTVLSWIPEAIKKGYNQNGELSDMRLSSKRKELYTKVIRLHFIHYSFFLWGERDRTDVRTYLHNLDSRVCVFVELSSIESQS